MDGAEQAVPEGAGVLSWDAEGNPVSVVFSMDALREYDAKVRAEERQRIIGDLARVSIHPFKGPDDTDRSMLLEAAKRIEGGYAAGGSNTRETTVRVLRFVAGMLAAGSAVPVATPEPRCEHGKATPHTVDPTMEQIFWHEHPLCPGPVATPSLTVHAVRSAAEALLAWCADPRAERSVLGSILSRLLPSVATPTEPVDEVKCPDCEATIRAQMSDRSTPERGAALEDLEHALTLALQAMAENDCCADEDDPDWRGPAIEQFRQDLRALGVRDAEMDAVGIKAPAEQDGQR